MEELIKFLISIKGINVYINIIICILFIYKLNPVTLLSSTSIERKWYSKEINTIYKFIIYIFLSLMLSTITSAISLLLVKTSIIKIRFIYYVSLFIGVPISLWIYVIDVIGKGISCFKNIVKKYLKRIEYFYVIYGMSWILIIIYTGRDIYNEVNMSSYPFVFEYITILIISFMLIICTLFIVGYPLINIIRSMYSISYYLIIGEDKWYILHMISREEFLLGNSSNPIECNKYLVINKEAVLNKEIIREENIETMFETKGSNMSLKELQK